jgi:ASC-1-like (ASCH) protein
MVHVAVVMPRYLELILAGRKTAELRLTRSRTPPHGVVSAGERVYFKQTSGPVRATAVVERVEFLEGLTPDAIRLLAERTRETVRGAREFFETRMGARFASVVHVVRVEPCSWGPDFAAERRARPRAAWLVLPDDADVYPACIDRGLLTG